MHDICACACTIRYQVKNSNKEFNNNYNYYEFTKKLIDNDKYRVCKNTVYFDIILAATF